MCKHKNITSTLVLTIVFGIHCNFFIVLSTWMEICRPMNFSFLQGKMCAPTSEVLRARARPIGISRSIYPGLYLRSVLRSFMIIYDHSQIIILYTSYIVQVYTDFCYKIIAIFKIRMVLANLEWFEMKKEGRTISVKKWSKLWNS